MNSRQFCSTLLLNLLIFGYVIPTYGQSEPIITDFSPQTLTWTNRQPNTYCDIEWICNLNHEWIGSGESLLTTQAVTTVDIAVLHNLAEQLQWLCRNAPEGTYAGFFLRVASSEQPIQPHVFTNTLRLFNVSYDHNGSNRVSQLDVMPVGPVEKNILLTVSNNSLTINLEWLRLTQTRMY